MCPCFFGRELRRQLYLNFPTMGTSWVAIRFTRFTHVLLQLNSPSPPPLYISKYDNPPLESFKKWVSFCNWLFVFTCNMGKNITVLTCMHNGKGHGYHHSASTTHRWFPRTGKLPPSGVELVAQVMRALWRFLQDTAHPQAFWQTKSESLEKHRCFTTSWWWFQIFFDFHPLPGEMIQFDYLTDVFRKSWFNHQLVLHWTFSGLVTTQILSPCCLWGFLPLGIPIGTHWRGRYTTIVPQFYKFLLNLSARPRDDMVPTMMEIDSLPLSLRHNCTCGLQPQSLHGSLKWFLHRMIMFNILCTWCVKIYVYRASHIFVWLSLLPEWDPSSWLPEYPYTYFCNGLLMKPQLAQPSSIIVIIMCVIIQVPLLFSHILFYELLPRQQTCPLKINGWKMYFLLK